MDYGVIATALVTVLGPLLGKALSSGGESAAEAVGEKLGEGLFEKAKSFLAKLRPKVAAKPGAPEAAAELAAKPDDPDARAEMVLHLKKILAADPEFAAEVEALVAKHRGSGPMSAIATHGSAIGQGGGVAGVGGGIVVGGSIYGGVGKGSGES